MGELRAIRKTEPATRISVTGRGGEYVVRVGSECAVRVRVIAGEARCECGGHVCDHITSLRACGFIDTDVAGVRTPWAA